MILSSRGKKAQLTTFSFFGLARQSYLKHLPDEVSVRSEWWNEKVSYQNRSLPVERMWNYSETSPSLLINEISLRGRRIRKTLSRLSYLALSDLLYLCIGILVGVS